MDSGGDKPTLGEIAESMEDMVSANYRKMKNIVANFFRTLSPSHEVRASPKKGDKMTILEKGRSRIQTSPDEEQPGTSKSDRRESRPIDVKGKSGRKDSDLISTATSALRRLNFRTAGGSHHRRGAASAPAGRNGTPLIHTSSSASETTTNTSQESSHTVSSSVTVDVVQGERTEQDVLESRALLEYEEGQDGEYRPQRAGSRPEIRSREILKDFDKLIYENQQLLNAEKARIRAAKNAAKFNQMPGTAAGGSKKGAYDKKKPSSTVTTQEKVDKGKSKKFDWSQRRGRQLAVVDDRQMPSCAPEPSPPASMFPQEQPYFLTPSMIDENVQDYDLMNETQNFVFTKPRTVKTIQSELPQRTFSTNFSKRKKMGDQKERKDGQAEERRKSQPLGSPSTSKQNLMDDIPFELPPRRYSPSKVAMSSSPRLGREMSTSSRKISSAPVTPPTLKEESAMTKKIQNATLPLETQEMKASGEDKKFGESTNMSNDFTSGPSTSKNMGDESGPSTSKGHTKTSENMGDEPKPSTSKGHTKTSKNTGDEPGPSTPKKHTKTSKNMEDEPKPSTSKGHTKTSKNMEDEPKPSTSKGHTKTSKNMGDEPKPSTSKGHNIKDNGRAYSDDATRTSHKRKKRHDRKPSNGENSNDDKKFFRFQNSRDAFFCSLGEPNIVLPQNPKYSVLATDGSVKNFVSENSDVFKNSGENINKENIKKSGEFPERHRRVSIIQGQSLRHFIFREPDTSQIKPSKQRKVAQVIEDTTRRLLLEDVQPRKASLATGDTTKDESSGKSNASDDKPRKFSINTLGDIVSARKFSLLPPGEIYTSQGSNGQLTEVIKLAPVANGKPLATIVVQQASIQRGSIQSEDALLDVTATFNLAELGDFDLRYGSPHHFRSQSVKTPGRVCGHPNYLALPQQRARVASMPNTGVEEEYYRLRNFSITGKGLVNRGDSLKSRRSRSNTSVASSNSSHSNSDHVANICAVGSHPGTARNSAECSLASSRDSSTANLPYRVILLGSEEVGKTALISQFMTSEYLNAYEASLDEEEQEKSISVLLDGEESELLFYEHPSSLLSFDDGETIPEAQAYVIVYSVVDRESFQTAERILQYIWRNESIATKAVILVGNKGDLARSRAVLYDEGIDMANAYDCKFIETSAGINHNVDELLAGTLSQIRLKLKRAAKEKEREQSPRRWRNTRLSASLKVKDDDIDDEGVDVTTDLLRGNLLKIYYKYEEEWFHRKRGEINDNDVESFTDEDVNDDIYIDIDDGIECNINYNTEHDALANDQNRGKRASEIKKRETVSKIKRARTDEENAPSSAAEASSNVAEASSNVAEASSNVAEAPSNAAEALSCLNFETNPDFYRLMFSPEILHYMRELDIIKNIP